MLVIWSGVRLFVEFKFEYRVLGEFVTDTFKSVTFGVMY